MKEMYMDDVQDMASSAHDLLAIHLAEFGIDLHGNAELSNTVYDAIIEAVEPLCTNDYKNHN